jgi:hypothetical protein
MASGRPVPAAAAASASSVAEEEDEYFLDTDRLAVRDWTAGPPRSERKRAVGPKSTSQSVTSVLLDKCVRERALAHHLAAYMERYPGEHERLPAPWKAVTSWKSVEEFLQGALVVYDAAREFRHAAAPTRDEAFESLFARPYRIMDKELQSVVKPLRSHAESIVGELVTLITRLPLLREHKVMMTDRTSVIHVLPPLSDQQCVELDKLLRAPPFSLHSRASNIAPASPPPASSAAPSAPSTASALSA